jgi:hypothetical protein
MVSAGGVYALKAVALGIRRGPREQPGWRFFLFAWPGVIPDDFRERQPAESVGPVRFLPA